MVQTVDGTMQASRPTWLVMLALGAGVAVLGLYLVPLALAGRPGTEPLTLLARGAGLGAGVLLVASALGLLVRGTGSAGGGADEGGEMRPMASDAPATIHSAPTQFEDDTPPDVHGDATIQVDDPVTEAPRTWSIALIQALEWKRFELLCAEYYREKGICHLAIPLAANGGTDLYLFQDEAHPRRATGVVHVKARSVVPAGVQGVRELLGVMAHERIERGFFMTSGTFTPEAKALGHHHKLVLIDARVLLAMIERLDPDRQQRLLVAATAGDYQSPSCPACGGQMTVATGTHGDYWGCSSYPACSWIMPMVPKTP
ncbi:hypothetical protein G3580_10345 [Nitrogeniibacter mangrovi]|uniref:Restriction endonuclease n=1 Tax=Nitrogeniibacter mangrovi TaxID=2016596 RepID=A0A6C1B2Z6_9RHOO|nr:restriction endonuclease [Nitrogeniibacter mangrovi]QID18006.1 hypothetical protein G3580_10345 [Nitrogeniibacter mangrovi]